MEPMTLDDAKKWADGYRPLDPTAGADEEACVVLADALTTAEHDRDAYKARLNATIAAGDATFAKYAQASVALEAAEAKVAALESEVAKAREAGFREAVEQAVEVVRTSINEQDDRAVEYRSKGRIEHGRSRDVAAYHLRKGEKAIRAIAPAEKPNPPRHPADAAFDGAPNYVEPAPKKPVFDAEKARDTMCGGEDGITPCGRVAVHLDDNGERTFACCGSDDCCGVTAGTPDLVTKVPLSPEKPARPATTTCRWCGWDLCAECMARHEVPTPEHLHHHASTDRCRGRKDTR